MKIVPRRVKLPQPTVADKINAKQLSWLEREIGKVYAEAEREAEKMLREYLESFSKRNQKMIEDLATGKIKPPAGETAASYYKKWLLNQVGRGRRYEAVREQLAQRIVHYDEVANAYINDATPGVYSLYRNYTAYVIGSAAASKNISYTLYNEGAVRRLIIKKPQLMPNYPAARAIKNGYDLKYSSKMIRNEITKAILNGKSLKPTVDAIEMGFITKGKPLPAFKQLSGEVAKNVRRRTYESAIRAARTANTSAMNGAKFDTMLDMKSQGTDIKKQWLSARDQRVRDSHIDADGEIVDLEDTFSTGVMFPADPNGEPKEVYNCRCKMLNVINGRVLYEVDENGDSEYKKYMAWMRAHEEDML